MSIHRLHRERMTLAQTRIVETLERDGWTLTQVYGDRIANVTHDKTGAMCFVSLDGSLKPPRTLETMQLHADLLNCGYTVRA